jgi:hypothetical protein
MSREVSGKELHLAKKIVLTGTAHKFGPFPVGKLLLTMLFLDNVLRTQRLRSNRAHYTASKNAMGSQWRRAAFRKENNADKHNAQI